MQQIKTALCSFGMSGKVFHAPLLTAHKGFALESVWQRTKHDARDTYPSIRIERSLEAILADPEIELVIVNTPEPTHFSFAQAALAAGKHVVVEKAFTSTLAEAETLIELSQQKGKVLSVFQNRRWDADFLTLQKVIQEELVGRIVELEIHYDRYRTFIQDSWKEEPETGGSLLYNLGAHLIDQALVLFGLPEKVFADLAIQRTGGKIHDYFSVMLYYPGHKVILKSSYLVREPGPRYQLWGEKGTFYKWGLDPQEDALKAGISPLGQDWGQEPKSEQGLLHTEMNGLPFRGRIESLPGNYLAYYDSIYAAIREGAELAVTAAQARNVMRVIEAALQSHASGMKISL